MIEVKLLNEDPMELIDLSKSVEEILNCTIHCYNIGYRVVPEEFGKLFDVSETGIFTLLEVDDSSFIGTHSINLESYVKGYENDASAVISIPLTLIIMSDE